MNYRKPALTIRQGKRLKGDRLAYEIIERLGGGGSGEVYRAFRVDPQARNPSSTEVAIKFFLPIYELNLSLFDTKTQHAVLEELQDLHTREIACLQSARHPGIVTLRDTGTYSPARVELLPQFRTITAVPFFVTDLVDGVNLTDFAAGHPTSEEVLSVLIRLTEALVYLHDVKTYMHADIRPENVIVRENTLDPVLIDFALYKNFNEAETDLSETTRLLGDWDLFPKDLPEDHPLKKFKETRGTRAKLKSLCFPALDLFQFGKLIRALEPSILRPFDDEDRHFLALVIDALLDWNAVQDLTAQWIRAQLTKLERSSSRFMGVEELTPPSSAKHTLVLPGRVITLSSLVGRLTRTRSFKRLKYIRQLMFVDNVYPGAGYPRSLHCMRAYAYCGDMLGSLVHSPRFRLIFDPLLARQALVMSLLHDINHFPLLHVFQESPEVMRGIDLLDIFCDGRATRDSPSIYELIDEVGLSRTLFKELLLQRHRQLSDRAVHPGLQIVKSLIDSGADVDKLAYLEDDSFFTGVPFGTAVDRARLIASATIVNTPDSQASRARWHLGFQEDGLAAVESLVLARYWMFRSVYWHRKHRSIIAMLSYVLRRIYVDTGTQPSEFIYRTLWKSEEEVLEYLDQEYVARYGIPSITRDIVKDEDAAYLRLLSVQGASRDNTDSSVYEAVASLGPHELEICRRSILALLGEYARKRFGRPFVFDDEAVLFDIPGRRLDTSGEIFVERDDGEVRAIEEMPGPAGEVLSHFERLTKRMRLFVKPKLFREDEYVDLVRSRDVLRSMLEEAVSDLGTSQAR